MSASERWSRTTAGARNLWAAHQRIFLYLSVVLLSVISALRLPRAFAALLWSPTFGHAIDTKIFHMLVHGWFASLPVYKSFNFAVHPPATYAILWPFFGAPDLPFEVVRKVGGNFYVDVARSVEDVFRL